MNKNLLIVDDEPNILSSLTREFRPDGYAIYVAYSGSAGLDLINEHDIGVVLSDLMMPGMDGVTFLETVKKQKPDVVSILLTAHGSLENARAAIIRSQIFAYLTKPWSSDELKGTIAKAFEHYNLLLEQKRLQKLIAEQNKQLILVNENLEDLVHQRTMELEEAVQEGIVMLSLA
ncbi:MAG: response regulator, partial [Deltaproteobacteria bacterium]|nr:response regulator [Deltaproteobacteria bacterium]